MSLWCPSTLNTLERTPKEVSTTSREPSFSPRSSSPKVRIKVGIPQRPGRRSRHFTVSGEGVTRLLSIRTIVR